MSVHVSNEIIKSEWTDYNKHLNMAYYVLIFDKAWEVILEKFKMGEHSAKTSGMSTMVVETNTTYDSEVKEGDGARELREHRQRAIDALSRLAIDCEPLARSALAQLL